MKITVSIPDRLSTVFKSIAKDEGISQTELVRRSLMLYAVLHKETNGEDKSIGLLKNGKVEKEIIFSFG